MKLTKNKIEDLAIEIIAFLQKNEFENGVCIYYNNKRVILDSKWDKDLDAIVPFNKIEENVNPLDYFEYANHKHILSMSFEGAFYEAMNYSGRKINEFIKILDKYSLDYLQGDAWNLSLYPKNNDYSEIEYTPLLAEPKQETDYIYFGKKDVLPELQEIMVHWFNLSKATGDIGSCVIGAGFNFTYKNVHYFMGACSPYQGSISWETHTDIIKTELQNIGATDISYDWGRMD